VRTYKTVSVDRTDLAVYHKRAEECLSLAHQALEQRLWFGVCINAVQAAIALADCFSIFKRGTRYSGSSHEDAVDFYATLNIEEANFKQSVSHFGKLISIKHAAEYADKALMEKDAQAALKSVSRLKEFIIGRLPRL